MAAQLPGRTDNDIKNYWNTKLKKKLMNLISTNPQTAKPLHHLGSANWPSNWSYPSTSSAITADYHPILPSDDHGYINAESMETYQVKDSSTLLKFEGDGQANDYGGDAFDDHNSMGRLKPSCKELDGNYEKASEYCGDSSLQSSLEEFKKLVSTNL